METIKNNYEKFVGIKSDINEHLPTLKELSDECKHVTEMGVRDVVSTWAILFGLSFSPGSKLRCYDIHKSENIESALYAAKERSIDMYFTEADVLKVEIEETEMLFIDTLHTYTQLKKELELHAKKVSKYLVFHDVITYGHSPEPASWQTPEIMKNYIQNDRGIMPAIDEFLASEEGSKWAVKKLYKNNNGLLVLQKNG